MIGPLHTPMVRLTLVTANLVRCSCWFAPLSHHLTWDIACHPRPTRRSNGLLHLPDKIRPSCNTQRRARSLDLSNPPDDAKATTHRCWTKKIPGTKRRTVIEVKLYVKEMAGLHMRFYWYWWMARALLFLADYDSSLGRFFEKSWFYTFRTKIRKRKETSMIGKRTSPLKNLKSRTYS